MIPVMRRKIELLDRMIEEEEKTLKKCQERIKELETKKDIILLQYVQQVIREKEKKNKMNRYTIYCTTEQVKKAIELGIPIADNCENPNVPVVLYNRKGYEIPTAEQMIGFILESGRGYSCELSDLIREHRYKKGCLIFIDNCLK